MAREKKDTYIRFIRPWLDKRDSETWHNNARKALHLAQSIPGGQFILRKLFSHEAPLLSITVEGINFENPLLVGAGWDKVGEAVLGLHAMGFGGVEVGSVLKYPQEGNPKPREFIVSPNGVAINRMGFNSPGMEVVAHNLEQYQGKKVPIGISVGKNKATPDEQAPAAHAIVVDRLYDLGDYFVINVSSPNTPGLRALQDKKPLTAIINAVQKVIEKHGGEKPLFVKIAPDLSDNAVRDVIDVVEKTGIRGIIAVNTYLNTKVKGKYSIKDPRLESVGKTGKRRTWADEAGGLSGDDSDYRTRAIEVVRYIYEETQRRGMEITIIGVGGIKDASTALKMIKAGATLVQVVTAIRGKGPSVAKQINRGIVAEMRRMNLTSYRDLVGSEIRRHTI
ncbi:MAG TPA: quinone-dependent dihydroorotate dehydrogenase [Candidatus Saccharimonadales bacterium]|nr:quinone-dependent dihydroorotate dehydrogenase [Candidatus Saccharimonadales bacterium]